MEFIKLKGVSKEYNKKTILEDIDLIIEEGDILGIIGESGSGKTTLLNLISGFIAPSEGKVIYRSRVSGQERNLTKNIQKIKKYIGFMPQHNSFYHKLTVVENLFHFGRLYGIKERTLHENIRNLLIVTKLMEHRHKIAGELSGGMQKRLDISCSLAHKPKLLLLDEPTADLDPLLQKEILHLLREVNKQGVTIVVASHHLEGIEAVCNKIAIISRGRFHSVGNIEEVRKPFLHEGFAITVKPGRNREQLISQLQTLPVNRIIDTGQSLIVHPEDIQVTLGYLLQFIEEEHLFLHDVDLRKPTLTEIFEKITAQPTPQNTTQPTPQNITQPTPQNIAQPIPQNIAQPTPQNIAQPTPQNIAQPTPQNIAQPTPQNITQPTPQNITQPTPQNIAQVTPQNITQPTPQNITQPTPQNIAQPIPQNTTQPTPQNIAQLTPQNIAQPIPQGRIPK